MLGFAVQGDSVRAGADPRHASAPVGLFLPSPSSSSPSSYKRLYELPSDPWFVHLIAGLRFFPAARMRDSAAGTRMRDWTQTRVSSPDQFHLAKTRPSVTRRRACTAVQPTWSHFHPPALFSCTAYSSQQVGHSDTQVRLPGAWGWGYCSCCRCSETPRHAQILMTRTSLGAAILLHLFFGADAQQERTYSCPGADTAPP